MLTKKQILLRCLIGGLVGMGALLLILLLLNLLLNSILWGGRLDYYNIQLTTDRAAHYFGSYPLAVLVEMLIVFLFGACVGLTTLPFAETWTNLPVTSILHFVITGIFVQLAGWSYQWLSIEHGPMILLVGYVVVYLAVWLVRWLRWNAEIHQLRKALGLEKEETL